MPVINVKKDGVWQDIASTYKHAHTVSDITDLPASFADDIESLKDKVGADSVAYQINTAIQANEYVHPFTHPADMITGLSDVAISGDYNDLKNLPEEYIHPESHPVSMIDGLATVATSGSYSDLTNKPVIPSIAGLATKTYVDEQIASVGGGSGGIAEQVQSDWDETDSTSPAYIKNKPVISGGGASVQANWNQKNDTAADFIKNKPFGEAEGLVDILPITIYTNFSLDSNYGVYAKADSSIFSLTIGETYIISWDGIEYECTAQDASILAPSAVLIGNASAFGLSGNNEPFIIACVEGLGVQYFSLTDTEDGGSHDIGIEKKGIIINHLDNKYLSFMDYVKPKEIDILPLTEYNNFTLDSNYGAYTAYEDSIFTLTIGDAYTVFWDGVEYECTAQDASILMSGIVALGNGSAFGLSGNNEPFIIGAIDGMRIQYFSLTDTEEGGSHSIKISKLIDGYHVIKEEYAPQSDWNNMKNKPFGTTQSGTVIFEEQTINCAFEYGNGLYVIPTKKFELGAFSYNVEFDGNSYLLNAEKDEDSSQALILYENDEGDGVPFFILVDASGNCFIISTQGEHTVKITLAEDAVKKIDYKYLPLPEVTYADNSKVMTVIDGKWTAQTPASGLPEVTTSDAGKFLRVSSSGTWIVETIQDVSEVGA